MPWQSMIIIITIIIIQINNNNNNIIIIIIIIIKIIIPRTKLNSEKEPDVRDMDEYKYHHMSELWLDELKVFVNSSTRRYPKEI